VVPDHTFSCRANRNIFTLVQEVRSNAGPKSAGYAGGGHASGHYFHVIAAPRPFVGPSRKSGLGRQGAPFFLGKKLEWRRQQAGFIAAGKVPSSGISVVTMPDRAADCEADLIEKVFAPAVIASAEHAHDLPAGVQ
jgi:hypothetical protein